MKARLSTVVLATILSIFILSAFGWTSKVSTAGVTSTLQGFVLGSDSEDDDASWVIELSDGDESTPVTLPGSFLPDNVKEGDPLKFEISIDEMRRVEADRRMEIRRAKQERARNDNQQ